MIKVYDTIKTAIFEVRKTLADMYDIKKGKYKKFKGLSRDACNLLKEELISSFDQFDSYFTIEIIHGEQRHNPGCASVFWSYQHTWIHMYIDGYEIYVDPISCSLQWLYDDIPSYYISFKKPKWYYANKENPAYHKILRRIPCFKVLTTRYDDGFESYKITTNFVEILQYEVWGTISDIIRSKKLKRTKRKK